MTSNRPRALQDTFLGAVLRLLLWFGGFMTGILALVLLMVFLIDKPFGIQIVSLFAITEFVFFLVFCDSRSWRGYSLRDPTVRQQLPHLLRIHSLVLGLIFVVLTVVLSAMPHLPGAWLAENVVWYHNFVRHQSSPFVFVLLLAGSVAATTEAWFLRKILGRALESAAALSGASVEPHEWNGPYGAASNRLDHRQILGWGVFCTGLLLALLGWTALEDRLYITSPQQPHPETGQVYPFQVTKGIVSYSTLAQKRQLDALGYSSLFLMAGGLVLAVWKVPRKRHHIG